MAVNFLESLTTYSDRATVKIADEAYDAAVLLAAGNEALSEVNNVVWWTQLLTGANNTSQPDDVRAAQLSLLVNSAFLNGFEAPTGIYGLYQPTSPTVISTVPFDLVTGDILSNASAAAEFAKVLYKSGGTMTGPLLISPSTRIDASVSNGALRIGTVAAGEIIIGRTGQEVSMPGTITDATWGGLAIPVTLGGLGDFDFTATTVGDSIRKNNSGGWDAYTPVVPGDLGAFVKIDGTTVMTGGLRLATGLTLDTSTAGAFGIGTTNITTLTIGRTGQTVNFPGTIGSGLWNGTVIGRPYGGFGNAMSNTPGGNFVYGYDDGDGESQFWTVGSRLTYGTQELNVNPNLSVTTLTATGAITSGTASSIAGTVALRNGTNAFTQTIRGTNPGASRIYDLPTSDPTAGQALTGTLSGSTITLAWASLLTNPMSTLGDTIYGGSAGVATRLAGNTTSTKKFLTSTGSGGLATAPTWSTVSGSDLSSVVPLSLGGTGSALVDPDANRIMGWDNATNTVKFFTIGSGLSYNAGTFTLSVDATGIVNSVAGTANRITVTGTTAVTVDIASTYVGQSTITTLGTIGTGDWQAGIVGGAFGGTDFDVTTGTPGDSIRVNAGATAWEWYTPGGGGGSGTVTSVDATIDGDAISISGGPITVSGTLSFSWGGSSSDYVDGTGTITNFAGAVDAVVAGTYVPYTGATTSIDLNAKDLGNIGVLTSGTLGYVGSNVLASFQTSVNSYNQFILQNTNAGASASSDFIVSNDISTDTTYYGDFGINSSTFTGTGSLAIANAVYVAATSSDLVLGTTTSNQIRFVVNTGATDAFRINTSSQLVVPAFSTAGVVVNSSGGVLSSSATLSPTLGGTGVANNAASTLTISGSFATTLTITGATGVTLPTSGTLATLAGSETFTNKTITASSNVLGGVTMTLGSDATGDIYYRNSGGVLTRLGVGSNGQILTLAAGLPSWASGGGGSGDVVGPGSATDNAIVRFDTTTGKLIQNSAVTIADTTGVIAGTQGVTLSGTTSGTTALVASAIAGTTTTTLPATTTTLAGLAVAQTFSAAQTISVAGSFTTASLLFAGTTNNWINFANIGLGLPNLTARTAGYKVVCYAAANGSTQLDYAMGVGANTYWFSLGVSTDSYIFYSPISSVVTPVFAISGTGNVSLRGSLTFSTATASTIIQASFGSMAIMSQNFVNLGTAGGTAAPALIGTTFATRSLGSRVIIQSTTTTTQADMALGYNTNSMWFSTFDTSTSFTWYGGATLAMTLSGSGNLTLVGDMTMADAKNIILNGTTGTKIGTATTQKLGFWNATPIVQITTAVAAATFVANTSLIANDTATFDGYTMGQVVKALRNLGLLA